MKKEIWKDVPEYEGLYQVSNLGRVKSLSKFRNTGAGGYIQKEKILKSSIDYYGYNHVGLYKNKKTKNFTLHQLMAIVFFNHIPNGHKLVVDHINNNPLDNRLENIQIITNRENCSKDKKGCSSKHTGVYWNKRAKKWVARIYINNKNINLGYFKKEIDAHIAYQKELNNIKLC